MVSDGNIVRQQLMAGRYGGYDTRPGWPVFECCRLLPEMWEVSCRVLVGHWQADGCQTWIKKMSCCDCIE